MSSLKKLKVVIDTNVFVSGILWGGNAEAVLRLFQAGTIDVIISPKILVEILTTLKKFAVSSTTLDELAVLLQARACKVLPRKTVRIGRDPNDRMLLEAAQAGRADYLITGDKDLLTLGSQGKTLILAPREFLELVAKG